MKHYSEADLLETYYMQPGESMPVMMHLARCTDCAAKYERLERKLREAASCESERPATFWSRQRISIMRRLDRQPRAAVAPRMLRVAAAAAIAFVLGGTVMYRTAIDSPSEPQPTLTHDIAIQELPATPNEVEESALLSDPWQSEELQDFGAVVEWESWVAEGSKR